jgi:Asp/Glu/hydantoin racemase
MDVTEAGMVTLVIDVPENALDAILVTLYVEPSTTKLDKMVRLPVADALRATLAIPEPTT